METCNTVYSVITPLFFDFTDCSFTVLKPDINRDELQQKNGIKGGLKIEFQASCKVEKYQDQRSTQVARRKNLL